MTITAKAKVALHQIDEYVWCDIHSEIHERKANPYDEDESDKDHYEQCIAENWRPVFTTDSELGQF
jgi:hypothetical protein